MGDSTARRRQFICNMPAPAVPGRCYRGTVIRNVVLVKLKPGQDPAEVADIQDDFRRLNCPGTLNYTIGSDLGLRDGNWSFAIVADFAHAAAYRAYDLDSAHDRARARLAPLVDQIARAQFEVPRDPFL
jgi:Stress responsive A/B Barrel Domain